MTRHKNTSIGDARHRQEYSRNRSITGVCHLLTLARLVLIPFPLIFHKHFILDLSSAFQLKYQEHICRSATSMRSDCQNVVVFCHFDLEVTAEYVLICPINSRKVKAAHHKCAKATHFSF